LIRTFLASHWPYRIFERNPCKISYAWKPLRVGYVRLPVWSDRAKRLGHACSGKAIASWSVEKAGHACYSFTKDSGPDDSVDMSQSTKDQPPWGATNETAKERRNLSSSYTQSCISTHRSSVTNDSAKSANLVRHSFAGSNKRP
jgi:hypothetical protein